nr:retrovirus-related Pol polyprotein from transposon TNT 1-94 [Tanacetum cinerariifolium]
MSRDVLIVGSTMRILLLYRGEYSQWVERFMNYLEEQMDGEAMIDSIKNGDQPLPRVTQVSIAGTLSTEQPPLKDKFLLFDQEKKIQKIDHRKAAVLYEYETFKATEGELLLDTYIRYLQVINDLKKCGYSKDNCELNFKFLKNLQPEWKQYATMIRQNKNLMDINIDALYDILKQNQGDVNDAMGLKKKTGVVTSDPLALIAEKTKVIGLGYTPMFLTHSDEALKIKKFKRARVNKIEFAYDYGSLNESYVNEKIKFSDDYFQEIINPDFGKIDSPFQQTGSLKPYVSTVILEKIVIDLEDEVVSLLKKEKANLEIIESLKSKGFESSENAISKSENQSENDCQEVEKECDKKEISKVIAPGMFKISVSQSISPISIIKTSCASNGVENVKRYSRKDLLSCNNSHLGETRSAYVCNDAKNVSCNSRLYDSFDENNLFIFDDDSVRISPVSKMPFKKKPCDSLNFLGTVRFGNNDFKMIAGYGDVVIGSMTIKKVYYVEVVVDDYSRYIWVFFLHSKDEASDVIISFINKTQVNLQLQVKRVRTDNGMEFKNKTLAKFFDEVGITQQFSATRTPQQNGVVERRNRTLVEAVRTMLTFVNLPLFLWAEAIATACFTQNHSIIHKCFHKTPYELINKRKPIIKFFRVFRCRCIFSMTMRMLESSRKKGILECLLDIQKSLLLSEFTTNKLIMKSSTMNVETSNVEIPSHEEEVFHESSESFQAESSSSSLNDDVQQSSEEVGVSSLNTQSVSNNMVTNVDEASTSHNVFNEHLKDAYFDASTSFHDPSNVHTFYQPYPHKKKWTKDHPLHKIISDPKSSVRTRGQLANSC